MHILYISTDQFRSDGYGLGRRYSGVMELLKKDNLVSVATCSNTTAASHVEGTVDEKKPYYELKPSRMPALPTQYGIFSRLLRQLQETHLFLPSLVNLVNDIKPDLIWYFRKDALRRTGLIRGIPSVLDFDDVSWRKRLLFAQTCKGLDRAQSLASVVAYWIDDMQITRDVSIITVSNGSELPYVSRLKQVCILPNGYDFPDSYAPVQRPSKRVLFIGGLYYYPNLDGILWFYKEVWPRIRAFVPDAQLDIVGQWENVPDIIKNDPSVIAHGFVENIASFYRGSAISVVPIRVGSGTRLKVLEAWANGLPVVATKLGIEGLAAIHGQTVLIADTPEGFSSACISILQNQRFGSLLAENAFWHGREHYAWARIANTVDSILHSAL